jgi:hypothetical protein
MAAPLDGLGNAKIEHLSVLVKLRYVQPTPLPRKSSTSGISLAVSLMPVIPSLAYTLLLLSITTMKLALNGPIT